VKDLDQEPQADERTIRLPERGATIKVYGEPVREVLNDFIGMIEKGTDPIVGIEDGLGALRIVEAARKSANENKLVEIKIPSRE
jgi:predicted dehydrogenase